MIYDQEPEDGFEKNDIIIYEDINGNIDIDEYFTKNQVEELKIFLKTLGYNPYYMRHGASFEIQKPFRNGKPFVMKMIVHDIDWNNPEVIKTLLISKLIYKKNNETILKELLIASGQDPNVSQQTSFAITARFIYVIESYYKWADENHKDKNLVEKNAGEFSPIYVEQENLNRYNILPIGANVRYQDGDSMKKAIVLEYDLEEKKYTIKDEEGFTMIKKRRDLERIDTE